MATLAEILKPEVIAAVLERIPSITLAPVNRCRYQKIINIWRCRSSQTLYDLVKPDIIITHKEPS